MSVDAKIRGNQISRRNLAELKPSYFKKGYPIPKWIMFCEIMINRGWTVFLYRARATVSKYIWVKRGHEVYKVRFSNHKARLDREMKDDCDYYVGVGNCGIITTEQVIDDIEFASHEKYRPEKEKHYG